MNKKHKKPTTEQLEIYKQRYETFRHLDKLRWQMLQITIAGGSVVLALTKPEWWTWAAVGMILSILGVAMIRIGNGIRKNGVVLRSAGNVIGDTKIPEQSSKWGSISFWIAIIMTVVGLGCLTLSIIIYTT